MTDPDAPSLAGFTRQAIVVGGSLVGSSAALALRDAGWDVAVLERSSGTSSVEGSGIGIDRRLLAQVVGGSAWSLPVVDLSFEQTTWALMHQLVTERLKQTPDVRVRRGARVTAVTSEGAVTVETASGVEHLAADLIVGADGYASVVRGVVAPERPDARYSGYVMWRGIVEEHELPALLSDAEMSFAERTVRGTRLVTFEVPGPRGETEPGRRRASFSWFDPSRTVMFQRAGYLRGSVAVGALRGADVPDDVLRELIDTTSRWPAPWGPAIRSRLLRGRFVGTPISESSPTRLARGRIALIGDAAHVVSPVTGAGLHHGLLDVQALAEALTATAPIPAAFRMFERRRLRAARSLVRSSQAWSVAFVASHRSGRAKDVHRPSPNLTVRPTDKRGPT